MELTIREVARMLGATEAEVATWVAAAGLPVYRVGDVERFHRDEVVEWAATHRRKVVLEAIEPVADAARSRTVLVAALERGGVQHDVEGADRRSIFARIVAGLRLPPACDRGLLVHMLEAREKMLTTAVGGGIAIPHVQTPVIMPGEPAQAVISFLRNPIEFGASDGQPVFCLVTLLTPGVPEHVRLLSHLATVLDAPGFRGLLQLRASASEILAAVRRSEETRPSSGGQP